MAEELRGIMSDTTTLKWIERALIPVLVAGFLSLSTCAADTRESVQRLKVETAATADTIEDTAKRLEELAAAQNQLLSQQHQLDKKVVEVSTTQKNFKEKIQEINGKTEEILRILRDRQL